MAKTKNDDKVVTCCEATKQMLVVAKDQGIDTVFERAAKMKACPIGADGSCCKNCAMGPCRVPPSKKEGEPAKVGVCGATQETIAARNFARMVAAGTAAHSDHGRGVAESGRRRLAHLSQDIRFARLQPARSNQPWQRRRLETRVGVVDGRRKQPTHAVGS